ncbi:MAG: gamma-glutamyl-gamma-aminobutyrate hydrolase [Gammaproteobacteria bacterium]|nr:gamma-glutamyl-gamma-aminobutyrate hydrolase [Gammaproteobacteria bacterium]
MKIKIGITQRVEKVESYNETRDSLDNRLVNWVSNNNYFPIPIPNNLVEINLSNTSQPNLEKWLEDVGIDALLLSGGNNIGDVLHRDLTEQYLLFWAQKYEKPLLGICRGMQMMGVFAGSNLIKIKGHTNTRHKLKTKNFFNNELPLSVNSFHDFALVDCPKGYEVIAESEDGSIEAIKHKTLKWEGWMWHPERELPFNDIDRIRFQMILNNAK